MFTADTTFRGHEWKDDALCREVSLDTHYPAEAQDHSLAKRICARCPVRAECLEHALATNEHEGIWGGLTPRQWAKIKRERAA